MATRAGSKTIRRSVVLPAGLVEEAVALAPIELRGNLNQLTVTALREFTARRRALAFSDAMAAMAADPAIRKESAAIAGEFTAAERDGLGDRK
jgi:hypothetical protein